MDIMKLLQHFAVQSQAGQAAQPAPNQQQPNEFAKNASNTLAAVNTVNPFYYLFNWLKGSQQKPTPAATYNPDTLQVYDDEGGFDFDLQGGGNYDTPLQGGYLQQAPGNSMPRQVLQAAENNDMFNQTPYGKKSIPIKGAKPYSPQPLQIQFQELPYMQQLDTNYNSVFGKR